MPKKLDFEAQLSTHIVQKLNIAYILADENLTVLTNNPAMHRWVDQQSDNFVGQALPELFPELVGIEDSLLQLFHTPGEAFVLSKIYRSDDEDVTAGRYFDLHLEAATFDFGQALLIIATNVTEQGYLEQELMQQRNELRLSITKLQQAEQSLRIEQEKSERLLLNILPKPIADRLKEGPQIIADNFPEVTILFADIVGFTELSTRVSPIRLVEMLNEIFSAFDYFVDKHNLEKIKTIGDSYMVVGGLLTAHANHAEAIAEMAFDMQTAITRLNKESEHQFSLRIGINTGPVTAGVIGSKKFIYDLWGDAVNLASRMESHGLIGQIQMTTSTYEQLKDKYLFKKRGKIEVKGKGEVMTYLLLGRNRLAAGKGLGCSDY